MKAGLLDTVHSGAWQSALSGRHKSDGLVYSPRTAHRRNTISVSHSLQMTNATQDALKFLHLPAAHSTHRTHKSVSAAYTATINEPSAWL